MLDFPQPTNDVGELEKRVQTALPDWSFDCVFDFGSNARDEAVSESDIDLWFLVHSEKKILLDQVWQKGRYRSTFSQFVSDYKSFEIVEIDTWREIVPKVKPERPLEISCPVADIRWFLWQLAHESDWQVFLYTIFGKPLIDPRNFLRKLKVLLWEHLPFHIHPDHGIVMALQRFCESEKVSLLQDLHLIEKGQIEKPKGARPIWLRFAVECIRDSIVLLTLLERGRPIWRRLDVLGFVEDRFPQYLFSVQKAYWYKSTDEGRRTFDAFLNTVEPAQLRNLHDVTREIVEFWHEVMFCCDRLILTGEAKVTFNAANWQELNQNVFDGFLRNYLSDR